MMLRSAGAPNKGVLLQRSGWPYVGPCWRKRLWQQSAAGIRTCLTALIHGHSRDTLAVVSPRCDAFGCGGATYRDAERLAGLIADRHNSPLVTHRVIDILRARMFAIACGHENADDLDYLRSDPGFKLACGRLPDSGDDLCPQPTMSRWENAPSLREVVRMTYAMIRTLGITPTVRTPS